MTSLDRLTGVGWGKVCLGEVWVIARPLLGLGATHTGTEYMVLRLLLNFSVASMNKLSMGVFWERRSFICRGEGRERSTDPVSPHTEHLSGEHSDPSQALPWFP